MPTGDAPTTGNEPAIGNATAKNNCLILNEIFLSIQGESSRAGIPTVFVRLTGCNLRCGYCDTTYAYEEGSPVEIEKILDGVARYDCKNVLITGGEPMMQEGVSGLAGKLIKKGYMVMLETNGTMEISSLPKEVVKIVDIKCPGSGSENSFRTENLKSLNRNDEIKFVVSSREDFDWAAQETKLKNLTSICTVNISPVYGKLSAKEATDWILKSGINFRLNLQLHKILWGEKRGV